MSSGCKGDANKVGEMRNECEEVAATGKMPSRIGKMPERRRRNVKKGSFGAGQDAKNLSCAEKTGVGESCGARKGRVAE